MSPQYIDPRCIEEYEEWEEEPDEEGQQREDVDGACSKGAHSGVLLSSS